MHPYGAVAYASLRISYVNLRKHNLRILTRSDLAYVSLRNLTHPYVNQLFQRKLC